MTGMPRWPVGLPPQECVRLLGSVPIGRLVFTARALPAVRPACHVIDGDDVLIRSDASTLAFTGTGPVLAYQADAIDPLTRLGWSVVVVGRARQVTDPGRIASCQRALAPLIAGTSDQLIAIHTDTITGFRLAAGEAAGHAVHEEGRSP